MLHFIFFFFSSLLLLSPFASVYKQHESSASVEGQVGHVVVQ